MAAVTEVVLQQLKQRACEADKIVLQLKSQVASLRQSAVARACAAEAEKLKKQNDSLRVDVDQLKQRLIEAEVRNGVKQVALPGNIASAAPPSHPPVSATKPAQNGPAEAATDPPREKKPKKEKKAGEGKAKQQQKPADTLPIDVSRLDMRIGKIVDVSKHPDADTLYVEQVDVGEEKPRTVVSGLVKHIMIDEMRDRLAIFMLNLKPAKMRGILSEGMIMCGSSPEKVEIIVPPPGVVIGDRVTFEGYPDTPDAQLNPKKKIWEQIQPDLRINVEGVAVYKDVPFKISGKEGLCTVPTMKDSMIK